MKITAPDPTPTSHLLPMMVICCGMSVKMAGMVGLSVRKRKAPTVKMEMVTLTFKGR